MTYDEHGILKIYEYISIDSNEMISENDEYSFDNQKWNKFLTSSYVVSYLGKKYSECKDIFHKTAIYRRKL